MQIFKRRRNMVQITKCDEDKRAAIYDGCFAKIDIKKKRKRKFWKERDGLTCEVISRHGNAVLVEITDREELVICQVEDLSPVGPVPGSIGVSS
jgi:hypothetical protein